MKIKITPKALSGEVSAISSKSHAHRLMIAAAMCNPAATVKVKDKNQDIEATEECLRGLFHGGRSLQELREEGLPLPAKIRIYAGESGSTLRFLLPFVTLIWKGAVFYGYGRLPERPLSPLKEEMEAHGCKFKCNLPEEKRRVKGEKERGRRMFEVKGQLKPGNFRLPGNVSSQFITGLLFTLPILQGDSVLEVTGPLESAGYVDLTLEVLREFGIKISVEREDESPNSDIKYIVAGGQKYVAPKGEIVPEGDWSNGAFWICADLLSRRIPGKRKPLICTGLSQESSQGDKEILEIVRRIEENLEGECTLTFEVSQIPDLVPVMAVTACCRNGGITNITGAGRLRIKESDRLQAVCTLINDLGGKCRILTPEEDGEEGLSITGTGHLRGGEVDSFGDHRLVMSAAVASIICSEPVYINGAEAAAKSYPKFFRDFRSLGGEAIEV